MKNLSKNDERLINLTHYELCQGLSTMKNPPKTLGTLFDLIQGVLYNLPCNTKVRNFIDKGLSDLLELIEINGRNKRLKSISEELKIFATKNRKVTK